MSSVDFTLNVLVTMATNNTSDMKWTTQLTVGAKQILSIVVPLGAELSSGELTKKIWISFLDTCRFLSGLDFTS